MNNMKVFNMFYDKVSALLKDGFVKASLITSAIAGFLTYGYYFTNNILNYDDVYNIPCMNSGGKIGFGRWSLEILYGVFEKLNYHYNIRFIEVIISLFILAVSCVLFCKAFGFKRKLYYILFTAVTVTFPAIASSAFFTFYMPYYMFSVFLVSLGFLIVEKNGKIYSYLIFSLIVSFSIGIYQAYYPFIISVAVLMVLKTCFDKNCSSADVLVKGIKYFISILLSYVFYRFFLTILLKLYGKELLGYQGINEMGKINLKDLPAMVKSMYFNYLFLPTHDYLSVSGNLVSRLIIVAVFGISVFLLLISFRKIRVSKSILTVVITFILPISANFITVMVPDGTVYTLMVMGLVSLFYYPIIILDNLEINNTDVNRMITSVTGCVLIVSALNYVIVANGNYSALQYSNIKTENYFEMMLTRIKSVEQYDENMDIVFVGDIISDKSFNDNWNESAFTLGGLRQFGKSGSGKDQINDYSRNMFIKNFLGYSVSEITDADAEKYKEVIAEMNTYPNDNSIRIVDNKILVKFE